jgi:hydroxymethylpyrimidine kinase/phosphomethylpyrimidine kinase/thiamine-phosphate diphosphorylase
MRTVTVWRFTDRERAMGAAGGAWRDAIRGDIADLDAVALLSRPEASWLLGERPPVSDQEVVAIADGLQAFGFESFAITDDRDPTGREFIRTPQAEGWLSQRPAVDGIELPVQASSATDASTSDAAAAPSDDPRPPRPRKPKLHKVDPTHRALMLDEALKAGFCEADALVVSKLTLAGAMPMLVPNGASPMPRDAYPPTGPERMDLYAVVDSAAWVERVAAAGVPTVQLRIKKPVDVEDASLEAEVAASVAAAERHGARLFVNDHWQLAIRHAAYGVHLGQEDLLTADLQAIADAGLRLGLSTHTPWEVARALAVAPSYIACGPVHATLTKDMPWIPQGEGNLAFWAALLEAPVVAIGGLDFARASDAAACGADGIAVLSGITRSDDPEATMRSYAAAVAEGRSRPRAVPPNWPRPTLPPR